MDADSRLSPFQAGSAGANGLNLMDLMIDQALDYINQLDQSNDVLIHLIKVKI